jgi:hypothetical protein
MLTFASVPALRPQLSVILTALNAFYKVMVVSSAIQLQWAFDERVSLIEQMERNAELVTNMPDAPAPSLKTSSGQPVDARSLAAQEGR